MRLLAALLLASSVHAAPKASRAPSAGAPELSLPALPKLAQTPAAAEAAVAVPAAEAPAALAQASGLGQAAARSAEPGGSQAQDALGKTFENSAAAADVTEPSAESSAEPRALRGKGGRPKLGRRKFSGSYTPPADGKVKVAFFDADSTLRVSLKGGVSANGPRDVLLLPWVGEKLAQLAREGYLIVIVSNQAGIGKQVKMKDADAALQYTTQLIRDAGGDVHYYDFAEKKNKDRKPDVGMALRLEKRLRQEFGRHVRVDKASSMMIGDSAYKKGDTRPDGTPGTHFTDSDRLFAENYGVAFHEPTDFFGWRKHGVDVFTKAWQVRKFLAEHPAGPFSFGLPAVGSRRFAALAKKARSQLLATRSYAVVDLAAFIPDAVARLWQASMPADVPSQITPDGRILHQADGALRVTLAGKEREAAMSALAQWISAFVERALPEAGPRRAPSSQLRVGVRGDIGLTYPKWHVDPAGLSATLSIVGPGTEVRDGERTLAAGPAQLLLFVGSRAPEGFPLTKPTTHRTPPDAAERALFVFRW